MKFVVFLIAIALASHCEATKSWNNDGYSDENVTVIGWITYLKRSALIALMLSAVLLYYVPGTRLYARRICYVTIDVIAEVLKTAVRATETEYMHDKMRLQYEKPNRNADVLASHKYLSREIQENSIDYADYEHTRKRRNNKTRVAVDEDRASRLAHLIKKHEERRKHTKEHRKCSKEDKYERHQHRHLHQHQYRGSSVQETPQQSRTDVSCTSKRLSLNDSEALHGYVKMKMRRLDVADLTPPFENSGSYMISGSPRQMSMIDDQYESADIVILKEPCPNQKFDGRTIVNDNFDTQDTTEEAFCSDHESPTRDDDDRIVPTSEEETFYKREVHEAYIEDQPVYQQDAIYHQQPSPDVTKNWEKIESTPLLNESARNTLNPVSYREVEQIGDNAYVNVYRTHGESEIPSKPCAFSKDHRVNFIEEGHDQGFRYGMKLSDAEDYYADYHCGEVPDGVSQHGRDVFEKHEFDEEPQRENQRLSNGPDNFLDSTMSDDDCEETQVLTSRSHFQPLRRKQSKCEKTSSL